MPPTAPEELYEGGTPATPAAPAALMGGGSPATATAATELLAGGSPATPAAPAALMGGGSPATATAATELLAGGSPASPAAPAALMGGGSPATPSAPGVVYPGAGGGVARMRVTPTLSPDATSRLIYVDQFLGHDRYTSTGTTSAGGVYPFITVLADTGSNQWILSHTASAGFFQTKEWRATLTAELLDADDWAPHVIDPFGGTGIPAFAADGDDILVTASLSDPRLAGDYEEIGTTEDGQPIWTKDGAAYTGANVAAMVFGAGVDEDDDGTYNLSFYSSGTGSGSGFYSTSNGSPPPTGAWTFFGDEMGRMTVSAIAAGGPTAPVSVV